MMANTPLLCLCIAGKQADTNVQGEKTAKEVTIKGEPQSRTLHAANRWCAASLDLSHSCRHFTQLRQRTHTRLYSHVLGTAQATTI